jgi:hypothetical protein
MISKAAFCTTILCAVFAMNIANADDKRPIKIRFAGAFLQNMEQAEVDVMGTPTGETVLRSLAFVKARGSLGRHDTMAVTFSGPPVSEERCPDGLIKIADILENNTVSTFNDLSVLYGNGTGVVCLDPAAPTEFPKAFIKGTYDGGTGRFRHARGEWSTSFGLLEPVGFATQFIAEDGITTGYITGVRGDD